MDTVTICGSHGEVIAAWPTGEVIEVRHHGGDADAYSDIRKFDFAEWCAFYKTTDKPVSLDILDIGFDYEKDGALHHENAVPDHREIIAEGCGCITVNGNAGPAIGEMLTGDKA